MKVYDALNKKLLNQYADFVGNNIPQKLYDHYGTYNYREAFAIKLKRDNSNSLNKYL